MMFVYDKSNTNFNTEGKGALVNFTERPIVTERPGYLEIRFQYDMNGLNSQWLKKGNYIKVTPNHTQEAIPFYIYLCEPDTVSELIEVTARAKTLQDLMDRSIPEHEFGGVPLQSALDQAKGLMTASYEGRMTTDNVRVSVKQKYEDATALYILFTSDQSVMKITRSEQEITAAGFVFRATRGKRKAAVIRKGDSLMQHFKLKYEQTDEFCTRVIPFTTVMSDYLNEKEERKTNKSKEYGTPILSPNVDKLGLPVVTRYVEFKNETLDERKIVKVKRKRKPTKRKRKTPYTTPDTKDKILYQYKYEDVEDLNDEAEDFFTEHPSVAMEKITATLDMVAMNAATDTYFGLYDTVEVYSEKYDIDVELRVEEVEWDPLAEQVVRVKFSNDSESVKQAEQQLNEGKPSSQTLSVQSEERNFSYNLVNYIEDSDGRHIMFHLTELPNPDDYEIGDIVFLENGGKTEIWEKEETGWVRTLSGDVSEEVMRELAKANERAEELRKQFEKIKIPDGMTLEQMADYITKLNEQQRTTIKAIGNDANMIYTLNRIQEEVVTRNPVTISVEAGKLVLRHNGSGFTAGEEYNLSFTMEEVERPHKPEGVRIKNGNGKAFSVVMKPTNESYLTKAGDGAEGQEVSFSKVYYDEYYATMRVAGHLPLVVKITIDDNQQDVYTMTLIESADYLESLIDGHINQITVACDDTYVYIANTNITEEVEQTL